MEKKVFKTDDEKCLMKNHSLITFEVSFPTSVYLASRAFWCRQCLQVEPFGARNVTSTRQNGDQLILTLSCL